MLISLGLSAKAYGLTCNPGRALSRAEWAKFGAIKKTISIEQFANQSGVPADSWLQMGIPEFLGDLLSTSKNVGISKGLIKKFPPALITPTFFITGAYLRTPLELRVAIKVVSGADVTSPIFQRAFAVPAHSGRLFIELEKAGKEIIKTLKLSNDKKAFMREAEDTANFEAYGSYIKGLEAMWRFNPNHIDVAKIWLNEARRLDPYFQKPYIALSDLYGYLALQAKAQGKSYSQYMDQLRVIETERIRFEDRPSPLKGAKSKVKKSIDPSATNRFLKGDKHFIAGVTALRSGNLKVAKRELEKAASLVPEDTGGLMELFNMYSKMGKPTEAAKVQNMMNIQGVCY